MAEGVSTEALVNNTVETISDDSVSKDEFVSSFEKKSEPAASSELNSLSGHQKPVHHLLGGDQIEMAEGVSTEALLVNKTVETISDDSVSKDESVSSFKEKSEPAVSSELNSLFGQQKPVHHLLGGGQLEMAKGVSTKALVNNTVETISNDCVSKDESVSSFEEKSKPTVSFKLNRLFGQQKPVHHPLGGGQSSDLFLWRNKKISAGVLTGATAVWVLLEWLTYHFISFICFNLIFGLVAQFIWSNTSGIMISSHSEVPRLVLSDELFINAAKYLSGRVNRTLGFLQDIACGGDIKNFLLVVVSLFTIAIISSWCNIVTILYLGFVGAHTLPVLYEKYEDQVDGFVHNVLSKFMTTKSMGKKDE